MDRVQRAFAEFMNITYSYCGESTDWGKCYLRLEALEKKVDKTMFNTSKNSFFYDWIREKLQRDIHDEKMRVGVIAGY